MKIKHLLIMSTFLMLLGCGSTNHVTTKSDQGTDAATDARFVKIPTGLFEFPKILLDRKTGCQYIYNGENTSFTLVVNADGTPYCPN